MHVDRTDDQNDLTDRSVRTDPFGENRPVR
jgi:hypothetical protein